MASINDKLGRPSDVNSYALPTLVKSNRLPGESVLEAYDLSRFDDTLPVYFLTYKKVTDPATGKVSVAQQASWKALVNKDNNTLTNLQIAPGYTDLGNDQGDYIELMPTAFWGNSLVDEITEQAGDIQKEVVARDELLADSIVRGTGLVTVTSGRTVAISDVVAYRNGIRYEVKSIPNKTLVATRHSYLFVNVLTGAVTVSDVAINAAMPVYPADSLCIARLTTNATTVTHTQPIDVAGLTVAFPEENTPSVFVPPFDCVIDASHSRGAWGFAGNRFAYIIAIPPGLTASFSQTAVTQGHDTQAVQMTARRIFHGAKKGVPVSLGSYTMEGSQGGGAYDQWLVRMDRV